MTVRDTTPPVLSVADVVAEATSTAGAAVTFAATATDIFGPVTVTYDALSGSTFALGATTVTATARDANGNTSARVHGDGARHDAAGADGCGCRRRSDVGCRRCGHVPATATTCSAR